MKKILGIVLAISILFSVILSGCNDKNNTVSDEKAYIDYSTDMQIMYLCNGGGTSISVTKSDKGYYYVGDHQIIIYVDRKTQKATPLCSKPNCLHNNSETCDAYLNFAQLITIDTRFGSIGTAIQYYDGSLYALCGEYDKSYINYSVYLMKMDPDGTNRTKITDNLNFLITSWFLHRGYFYYASDSALCRIPLNSIKTEPEIIYKAKYYLEGTNTFDCLYAYDNYIYFNVNERDYEENGEGRQTYSVNLKTMEKTKLEINNNYASIDTFIDNKMIISCFDSDKKKKIYEKTDLNGQNGKQILSQDEEDIQTVDGDGTYLYFDNAGMATTDSSVEQIITVCDMDLNIVDTFKLPEIHSDVYSFFCPQDENYFLLASFDEEGNHILVMADKSQIGSIGGKTIEYTELCKLDWKENKKQGAYIS